MPAALELSCQLSDGHEWLRRTSDFSSSTRAPSLVLRFVRRISTRVPSIFSLDKNYSITQCLRVRQANWERMAEALERYPLPKSCIRSTPRERSCDQRNRVRQPARSGLRGRGLGNDLLYPARPLQCLGNSFSLFLSRGRRPPSRCYRSQASCSAMLEISTGGRSRKRAMSDKVPPIASTVLFSVESRRSLRCSSRETAS